MLRITAECISTLLRLLYAASADAALYEEFLREVQGQTESSRAYLLLADPRQGSSVAAQVDWDDFYTRMYAEHFAHNDPLVSAAIEAQQRSGGEWAGDRRELLSDKIYLNHASYQEMLVPVGDLHLCGTMITVPDGLHGSLVLRRHRTQKEFEPDVVSLLNVLTPHLKQSLRLNGLLRAERLRGDAMESSVEAFGGAVMSVDAACRVCHVSPAASLMLGREQGLELRDGELRPAKLSDANRLRALIAGAVTIGRGKLGASVEWRSGIPATGARSEGSFDRAAGGGAMLISRKPPLLPLQVAVMPFTSDAQRMGERTAALIFLHDGAQAKPSRARLLRQLYGLTPAEARVADLLLQGSDAREVAEQMHITLETARFQIKRVLSKSGSRRQSELIRTMLALPGLQEL